MSALKSFDELTKNTPKFNKGDKVYFIGDPSKRALKNNFPYEVVDCVPNNQRFYSLSIRNGDIIVNDTPDNFISEKDYKNRKNKKGRNDFKGGDIVYYNGPAGQEYEFDHAYTLFEMPGGYFSLKIGKSYKESSKEAIDAFFISQDEYKQKRGFTHEPDSNKILLSSLPGYRKVQKFNVGDKVYFIGTETRELKNDTVYNVQFYNNERNIIKVNGVVLSSDDFMTKEEYDKINNDTDEDVVIVGKSKTDVDIKKQIFKDTKSGKLKWYKPFSSMEEWYRAKINLEKPTGSYLKIEIYKTKSQDNKWVLVIYYCRTDKMKDEVRIKEYPESSIITATVNYIERALKENEPDDVY